jgi:hypothetical protein
LNAALVALENLSISRVDVARYSKIIDGVKVYNDLFAKFVNYRGIEIKVLELEKQLASEKNRKAQSLRTFKSKSVIFLFGLRLRHSNLLAIINQVLFSYLAAKAFSAFWK